MAQVTCSLLANFKPTSTIRNILAISSSAEKSFGHVRKVFESCKISEPEWLNSSVNNLKANTETVNSVDVVLHSKQDDEPLVKCSVAVLPSTCARHNTPTFAHVVGSFVKDKKDSDDSIIVLSPSSEDGAFAQSCAVGRNYPLFSMKSTKSHKVGKVQSINVLLDLSNINHRQQSDEALLRSIQHNIDNIRLAQRLVDTPPNYLHVSAYVEEARKVAADLGCEIQIMQGQILKEKGYGGLFGVGQASEHPPALVVLSHYPAGTARDAPSICLVGKGIVYDTGGLSIKTPTAGMCGMKMDMGGSAAVLGAFAAAVRASRDSEGSETLRKPLHAVLCIAENSVDERSMRNDDILTMLSGKTVEVNNTDAEGRLVLADGVYHAASVLGAGVIVDIATLTGAQLIATGKRHAAIYCSDELLEQLAVEVGKATGDLVHPLPYCPEFFRSEFTSKVADMKNSVKDRTNAQSSCAGQFIGNHLEEFLNQGTLRWLHVDMAGPAWADDRGTGYGVALLSQLVKRLQ